LKYEKILKRDDKSRIKIEINFFYLASYDFRYEVAVYRCEKGKRKWINCCNTDSYIYLRLNMSERKEHEEQANLMHVTKKEIYQAKIQAWERIKPEEL
jgi:hypothetical protein